ncbi:hypothetical protein Ahy_B07g087434 [Arachis hypogaea]|uniref:FBD domain-containing protein n=1 Tax=Arachis hypogaea TaxID=3818 RepID=A0A444YC53_ARAHY|nr:hypothetical protein Ahy_B07g087434 [Arachis hypogaea]
MYLEFSLFNREVKWDGKTFKEMQNLKKLIIKKYFSYDFQPKDLFILKLPEYHHMSLKLNRLSKTNKFVSIKLKVLNFDYSNFLKEIFDVANFQTLQEFFFKDGENLVTVHSSVNLLNKLNAEDCNKLQSFSLAIKFPLLEKFFLFGCSSLKWKILSI